MIENGWIFDRRVHLRSGNERIRLIQNIKFFITQTFLTIPLMMKLYIRKCLGNKNLSICVDRILSVWSETHSSVKCSNILKRFSEKLKPSRVSVLDGIWALPGPFKIGAYCTTDIMGRSKTSSRAFWYMYPKEILREDLFANLTCWCCNTCGWTLDVVLFCLDLLSLFWFLLSAPPSSTLWLWRVSLASVQ